MESLWRGTFLIEVKQVEAKDRRKPFGMLWNNEGETIKVKFEGSLKGAIRYALKHHSQNYVNSLSFYDENGNWLKEIDL